MIEVGDEGEVLDEDPNDDADERPDDCQCIEALGDHGLPCWPCYAAGFREPPPEYPDDADADAPAGEAPTRRS